MMTNEQYDKITELLQMWRFMGSTNNCYNIAEEMAQLLSELQGKRDEYNRAKALTLNLFKLDPIITPTCGRVDMG